MNHKQIKKHAIRSFGRVIYLTCILTWRLRAHGSTIARLSHPGLVMPPALILQEYRGFDMSLKLCLICVLVSD